MVARLLIILSIITSSYAYSMEIKTSNMETNAMEVETEVIIPIDLSRYPLDILDLIANFLPFDDIESEQEFIDRTKALKIEPIPQKYLANLPFPSIRCSAYSPDNATIALLEKCRSNKEGRAYRIPTRLIIINRKNNNQQTHNIGTFRTKYFQVTVSRDGHLVATAHSEIDDSARYTEKLRYKDVVQEVRYKDIITIFNPYTKKGKSHDIPSYFELGRKPEQATIAFNKQGTQIILYGHDHQLNSSDYSHMIIPLTVHTPIVEVDNKKTLEKYFKQRMVCKEFNQQLLAIKNS